MTSDVRAGAPQADDRDAVGAGSTASVAPWRRGERGQIALLSFAHGVQHFYAASLAFSYPYVVAHFGISYALLGGVLGAAGVVGGLLQALAGLVRRVSARWLLVGQDIGLAATLLLAALAPVFAVFALARCLASIVQWPQHPVGSAYLSDRVPHRRSVALSWHTIGGSIGTLVVPLVAGVVNAAWGWRWALGVFVPGIALGALVLWLRMEDPARPAAAPSVAAPSVATPPVAAPPAAVSLVSVLRRRTVLAILAAGVVAAAGRGLGVLTAYIPAFLSDGRHLDSVTTGALFTVVLVGSVVGPAFAGWLADRVGRRRVLLAVYPLAALCLAGYVSVGSSTWALAGVGLLVGVFAYAESPLLQSLFADATQGANSRSVFGVFFAIAYGVGAIWTAVVGWLVTAHGFRTAFVVMAVSFVVAGLLILVAREHPAAAPAS
ncbi:MAG: MFS transporter [Jatrophihabitans sp.]|nr:MAG: MFS transporter [Jatrophihabitans sp.]